MQAHPHRQTQTYLDIPSHIHTSTYTHICVEDTCLITLSQFMSCMPSGWRKSIKDNKPRPNVYYADTRKTDSHIGIGQLVHSQIPRGADYQPPRST